MIIVMQVDATAAQIEAVASAIKSQGVEPLVLPGEGRVAIGIPAALTSPQRDHIETLLNGLEGVSKVTETSHPYKLASREFHRVPTVVEVKGVRIGDGSFQVFGGPCSIESYDQLARCAEVMVRNGVRILRGGAFKPRTSPYAFQGLGEEGLRIMQKVGQEFGLVTITEAMSPEHIPLVVAYADMIQIGARSMQNFPLLIEAGKSGHPVFLKRGPASTIDDFLLAAEYVLSQGNGQVVLCERGLVGLDKSYTRNTLDISAVPVLKDVSHLPVIIDPSHGTGKAKYVAPMAKAALAAGADGVMIEMHPSPHEALSDGSQALTIPQFEGLMKELSALQAALAQT